MKKLYLKLHILFVVFIVGISLVSSYSGQVPSNISILITNTSLSVYNEKIGNQIMSLNCSNPEDIQRNYSWNVDYQYDFSGQNVTIINYTIIQNLTCLYNCSSKEDIDEVKTLISNQKLNYSGEEYLQLYRACFTNLTICDNYRATNQNYKSERDSCVAIKDSYYQQNLKCEMDYNALNSSYSACVIKRDDYSAQRWIFGIVVITICSLFLWWKLNKSPYKSKMATRNVKFTNMSYAPKVEEVMKSGQNRVYEIQQPMAYPPMPPQQMQQPMPPPMPESKPKEENRIPNISDIQRGA